MLEIYDISIDNVKNPKLVKTEGLRFGWKINTDAKNARQTSYRIVICDKEGEVFNSSCIQSEESVCVEFENLTLAGGKEYTLTIAIALSNGESTQAQISFATGISADMWGDAEWIKPIDHIVGWAPYIRTKFELGKVKSAVMYACGLGCAEYYINGKRTDDYYVDPPMTNYEKEVFYRRFDVTDFLIEGGNALCVLLGEGFYSQSRVWGHKGFTYGDVCVKIRLDITLEDGNIQTIVTNTKDWKYKYSPITINNIYGGETYDCRLETVGFAEYDGSENGWGEVMIDATPKGELKPCLIPPVRVIRELPALSVKAVSGKGAAAWIFDIGVNMAGVAEFHLPHSPRGAVYVFRYAETLDENGNMDYRSTGASATQCIQEDIYICRGDAGGEIYRPRLCYHGYRFIEMTGMHDLSQGYGTPARATMAMGIQLSTDFEKTGYFHTDYEPLEDLYNVMDNTFRSNFHGLPEDCPAREKCGWLGDAQVCANYGLLTYDIGACYEKFLHDIRTEREVYGVWQMIAPGKRGCGEASPLWGCAQIIIPYYMWRYLGDKRAILDNFDLMQAWFEHEVARSEDYIISVGLGDWDPAGGNDNPRRMPIPHSSTLIFYEIAKLMGDICAYFDIGDSEYYVSISEKIKDALIRHFYDFDKHTYGYWGSDGVALNIGAYPCDEREALLLQLVDRIKNDDYEMPTAIYSNKYLVPLLLREGYGDVALKYLFNPNKPSFKTMLSDNATSLWEEPDMTFSIPYDRVVSSYNHPMHGGFLYSCYCELAGIYPINSGFKRFMFSPAHLEMINDISAGVDTPYGMIEVKSCKHKSSYEHHIVVPFGVECVVLLQNASSIKIDGVEAEGVVTLKCGKYNVTEVL